MYDREHLFLRPDSESYNRRRCRLASQQLPKRQGPLEKRELLLHTLVVQSAYLNACTLLRYDALHGPRPPLTQTAFCPPFGDAVKCSSALHCFFTLLTHRGFFDSSAPPKGTYVAPCVRADPRPKNQGNAAPSPGARTRRCYTAAGGGCASLPRAAAETALPAQTPHVQMFVGQHFLVAKQYAQKVKKRQASLKNVYLCSCWAGRAVSAAARGNDAHPSPAAVL